jgi:pSer/pThr/pTyr-binding forkhead associated (FHA) protein
MTDDDETPRTDRVPTALASGGQGLALELAGRMLVVGARPLEIGRSASSDLVIDHVSVSRHHARIVRGKDSFEVLDLDSRNGVFVDERRVRGSAPIYPGVVLKVGEISIVVRSTRRSSREERTTRRDQPWSVELEKDDPTRPLDRVLPFMSTVDEALAKGDPRHAEWVFVRHVARPVERAALRGALDPYVARLAAALALRIGESTASDAWLDFVIRLYSEADHLMPPPIVNAMQALASKLGGLDRSAFRQYVARLVERSSELTPEERHALGHLTAVANAARSTRAAG